MAINGKKKGNRIELQLAKELSKRFNEEFKRVPQSGAWGTVNANSNVREDAQQVLTGDIMCPANFKFSIESKGRIDFNFWDLLNNDTINEIDEWIIQAENDAKRVNKEPLIYVKINNKKPFVLFKKYLKETNLNYKDYSLLRFDYFLNLKDEWFYEN